jgi:hypothetical protein
MFMAELDDYDDDLVGEPRPSRGPVILVLGALGFFLGCLPLGVIAWVMARREMDRVRRRELPKSDEPLVRAGLVVAIVATCIGALVTLALTVEAVLLGILLTR